MKNFSVYITIISTILLFSCQKKENSGFNKNNLSTTCLNCEDLNKPAYIISSNNGKSWHKYSLPQAADGSNFSGVTNNRLFAVTTSHDPADRTKSIYDLYSNDITVKHANWVKSDIKDLLAIPATYNNKDVTYNFTQLTNMMEWRYMKVMKSLLLIQVQSLV
mgnify:CR=1 FL=1